MTHRTAVFITVDTEASIAGCFENPERDHPLLHEPVDGVVNGKSEGLGFILSVLGRHGLTGTFFVETLQSRYFGSAPMKEKARQIVDAGQDLQLHVHPCWRNFDGGRVVSRKPADHSTGRSHEELVDIFREATDHFLAWGLGAPTAVRTGNFSVGLDTFRALEAVGIRRSSCISIAGLAAQEQSLQVGGAVRWVGGVLEVPLTAYWSYSPTGSRRLRPLTIAGSGAAELRHVLDQAHDAGLGAVCINMHPFDFVARRSYRFDGLRPNRPKQRRFEALCEYLAANDDRFAVRSFSSLSDDEVMAENASRDLDGGYIAMLKRSAENLYSEKLR